MLGGAQYWKHKVFSCARRRCEAMLGGYGGMLPRIFFFKMVQFSAFWCILGPILAFKILLFLRGFLFCFLNVAFADKFENKEKEEP